MPKQPDNKTLDSTALKTAARKAGFADVLVRTENGATRLIFTGHKGKGDMFAAAANILKESSAATDYNMRSIDTAEGRCVTARIAPVETDIPEKAAAKPSTPESV
jgi:hypothetical protein